MTVREDAFVSGTIKAAAGQVLTFACAIAWSTAAMATDGYMQNGIGARNKALAGAGVAYSTDATAASLNPAGIVFAGNQFAVSLSMLNLQGGFDSTGTGTGVTIPGQHDSTLEWIFIPNLAVSKRVTWGLVDSIALTAYGNGGVATRYMNLPNSNPCGGISSGAFCGGTLGLTMQENFVSVAFAKQVMPGLSIGVAPIVARKTVEVEGVGLFSGSSIDAANFSNQGKDVSWGVGVRGGIEWIASPWLRFGVAGNSPMSMSKFDKYRGLFAGQGDADIPGSLQAGVAVAIHPNLTLMADYKHIWYDNNVAVANPSTNFELGARFGADNGAGFGLQNVSVVKLGLEWRQSPALTWRAGYSYNTAPLKDRDADLNILTLGTVQHHITSGFKYQATENLDFEVATMYAPRASIKGPELGFHNRLTEIEMTQFEVTAGIVYRFAK